MKRGIGSSRGAITILNAIPTGVGAAMGITLQTDAEIEISAGRPSISVTLEENDEDDSLAKECVKLVLGHLSEDLQSVRVRTRSSIPISRGLKSSSAAANAICLATMRALGATIMDIDIVKLGVEAARRTGVTVTGAFDDATACYFGGIHVTDNSKMEILAEEKIPERGLRIILHVPDRKIRKIDIGKDTFNKHLAEFKKVERLVLDGEYFEAMTMNGRLIARSLGIDNRVSQLALRAGAISAGISGTGPATAIVVKESNFQEVLDIVSSHDAVILTAHPNEVPAPEVIPRLCE